MGKRDFNEDISEWNTSKVTNQYETFSYAASFTGDISKWDVSNVWKMFGLFNGAKKFNSDISGWDTSSVTKAVHIFEGASAFLLRTRPTFAPGLDLGVGGARISQA